MGISILNKLIEDEMVFIERVKELQSQIRTKSQRILISIDIDANKCDVFSRDDRKTYDVFSHGGQSVSSSDIIGYNRREINKLDKLISKIANAKIVLEEQSNSIISQIEECNEIIEDYNDRKDEFDDERGELNLELQEATKYLQFPEMKQTKILPKLIS